MLFAKENYYNSMNQVQSILTAYQEIPQDNVYLTAHNPQKEGGSTLQAIANVVRKASDETSFLGLQEKKLQMTQAKSDVTKAEYEKTLAKLNGTVDLFETHYKPVMSKIQESDEMQITQVKLTMDRFAKSLQLMGDNFKVRGEEMS